MPQFTAVLAIFLFGLVPRLIAAWKVDMTWDEGLYALVGLSAVRNAARRNFSSGAWSMEFHPPVAMYLAASSYALFVFLRTLFQSNLRISFESLSHEVLSQFKGRVALLALRLPSIVLAGLTGVLICLIAEDLFGVEEIAVLAGLFFAITPVAIAWSSLALLESSAIFFSTLSIWTLLLNAHQPSLLLLLVSGVSFGLALGSREIAIALPLVVLPWLAFSTYGERFAVDSMLPGGWGFAFLVWLLTGLTVLYALWPWLWGNPISRFLQNLKSTVGMDSQGRARWHFYLVRLFAATPITLIGLYIAGIMFGLLVGTGYASLLLTLTWAILPLLLISLPSIPKRGGSVEVSYVTPAFSILAAIGAYYLLQKVSLSLAGALSLQNWQIINIFLSLGVLLLTAVALESVGVAPYYMNYFNHVSKALDSERRVRLEGWWGEGMAQATHWVDQHAPTNAIVWIYGPRGSAFYHSRRVSLKKSLQRQLLLYERSKAGFEQREDPELYRWRDGDLRFEFPYYGETGRGELSLAELASQGVSHIVVYRWATYFAANALDSNNRRRVSSLMKDCLPNFTVKVRNLEVGWIYDVRECAQRNSLPLSVVQEFPHDSVRASYLSPLK